MDIQYHIRRHEAAKSDRDSLSWIYRDCYALTYPIRGARWSTGGASASNNGQSESSLAENLQAELYDETGADSVRILAAALKDGGMPATSRWFALEVDEAGDEGDIWLDQSADKLHRLIHASNFDAVAYEHLVDEVIAGQAVMFIDENREEGGFHFEQWDTADCTWCASRQGGTIDTIYREFTLTAEQAVNEFGDRCSEKVRETAGTKPTTPFTFLRAIFPREGVQPGPFALTMPFASVTLEMDSKTVLREGGYMEFPCAVPRWMLLPGSQYAVGPAYTAMPAMKQLNETIKLQILGLEVHAGAGTYKAIDDGVLNPRTVRLGNRRVITVGEIDNLQPLAQAGDLQATLLDIERLQKGIRKVFMADALEPQDGPTKTATEINVRVDLIRQQLGPMYGRQQAELHTPIVERCFAIALRNGAFGPVPESLNQRPFRVRFISPLARAQQLADVTAIDQYVQGTAMDAQLDPSVLLNVDMLEANRIRAERVGVPKQVLRTRAQIEAIQKQQRQAQAAQQAEMLQGAAAEAMDNGQPVTAAAAATGARARLNSAA